MDREFIEENINDLGQEFEKNQSVKPAIILVNPHNGDNVGSISRVMANFGLSDLRIIRTAFTKEILSRARVLSAGHGDDILENVQLFDTVEDAVKDIEFLLAFTARTRGNNKENYEIQDVMSIVVKDINKAGFMFGNEKSGLSNEEMELAHATCFIPSNPKHKCLNLSQSVAVGAYQWFQNYHAVYHAVLTKQETAPISDLNLFFDYAREKISLNGHSEKGRKDVICEFRDFCLRTYCTKRDLRLLYRVVEFLSEKKEI